MLDGYSMYKTLFENDSSAYDLEDFYIQFKEVCYELYKIDWINSHVSPQLQLKSAREYALYFQEELAVAADRGAWAEDIESFTEWVEEVGYANGMIYVSYNEFIDCEFKDEEYMYRLLEDEELLSMYKDCRSYYEEMEAELD